MIAETEHQKADFARKIFYLILFNICMHIMPHTSSAQTNMSQAEFFAFRMLHGQDLKTEIEKKVIENGWKAVSIVTCVGSLHEAKLRFANQKEGSTVPGKLEIVSLTGTLSPDGSHLHLAVSDSTGKTIGGHLLSGCLVYTTAEVVLAILKDYSFDRETDATFGYKELVVKPVKK